MDLIAYATDLVHEPTPVKGAKLESLTFTTPAEPSFPRACGTHSGTAGVLGGVAAPGLVCIGTSDTISVDSRIIRLKRMRRGVFSTVRILEETFKRDRYKHRKAFITLTYREGVEWSPRHITNTLKCYASWARRKGFKLTNVWVAELQQRGAVHYHIVLWLPRGLTPPMPDKQGWWKHGSSNAKWVRSPIGYLTKYLSSVKVWEGMPYPTAPEFGGLAVLRPYNVLAACGIVPRLGFRSLCHRVTLYAAKKAAGWMRLQELFIVTRG
jgi:hypothetical protein